MQKFHGRMTAISLSRQRVLWFQAWRHKEEHAPAPDPQRKDPPEEGGAVVAPSTEQCFPPK